jgi:hypothetical protein
MKTQQQQTVRSQHSPELREDHADLLIRDMDQRVPGDQPGQRRIRQPKIRHRAHLEPQTRVIPLRYLDHPRRQIEAEDIHPQPMQMRGDMPRTTPHVRDQPTTPSLHQIDEQRENRSHIRCFIQKTAHLIRVPASHGVIRDADIRQPGLRIHAETR